MGQARDCRLQQRRSHYDDNAERLRSERRTRYQANADAIKAKQREAYEARRDEILSRRQQRAEAVAAVKRHSRQKHAVANATYAREYRRLKPEVFAEASARRRAAHRKATPPWADRKLTREIYEAARMLTRLTGVKWSVDHIVPLQGKTVCGLHWHGNLQLLPATVNIAKSNRTWPDAP